MFHQQRNSLNSSTRHHARHRSSFENVRKDCALFKDVITEREPITTTFRQRHTGINHFSERFSMKGLYPTVLTQPSPLNNHFYPVHVHNAQAMIESLLYLSLAKDDNNLIFPNPDDPLAPPPSVVQNITDIDTGDVYRNAPHKNLCTRPNQVVCGIICYIDKLATDRHGHLSLDRSTSRCQFSIKNQKSTGGLASVGLLHNKHWSNVEGGEYPCYEKFGEGPVIS
jgi:hypothetical protein